MKRLLILGAGQYGMVAKEIAETMECFDKIEFLDDSSELAIGKLAEISEQEYDAVFIAIGNPDVRSQWCKKINKLTTLIHPQAVVMPTAKVGKGSIIEAGAVVCSNAVVGNACIIMANAVVGHNATVGDYCQLKYGCVVSERSAILEKTKIDCNVVI